MFGPISKALTNEVIVKINENETLYANVQMDEKEVFSIDIETLRYSLKSHLLEQDIDSTHELYINSDKRNFAVQLLLSKARIDYAGVK